jgi:copper chaperone CopZ
MVEPVYCVHCGAMAKHPVFRTINGQSLIFCCGGCAEVYEMMHEEGMDAGQGMPEMDNKSLPGTRHPTDIQPDESAPAQIYSYHVAGMTCANCVATVTRQLRSVSGVLEVNVSLETERAAVKMIPEQVSLADLKRAVEKAGYEISAEGVEGVS